MMYANIKCNLIRSLLKTNLKKITVHVRNYSVPRRALMYVPGDDLRKLDKAYCLEVDCIAMDFEDGVALNRKDTARNTVRELLNKGRPQKEKKFDWGVRVNSIDSNLCSEDIKAILTAKNLPDTILLPKVENKDHIKWFSEEISKYVSGTTTIDLIMYIESVIAFLNIVEICETAKQLSSKGKFVPSALVFGSDDFCASLGASRTENSMEILYARQKLVMVAKAYNMQAIDMVYIKFKDLEGLQRQSEEGARMGYTGKQVIHPAQVPVVQKAFLPNDKQILWALGLLKQFEEHQKTGKGAFMYQGSMIDMPTMKQAQNIVNLVNSSK